MENFAVAGTDANKINAALNSVIACKNTKCDESKIRTFIEFKKKLGWNNFNVLLFLKLLKARETQSTDLTLDQVNKIISEGKFEGSFTA